MGLVFVFFVLKELQEIFIPLVLAFFLFFVFSPLNNFLENKRFPLYSIILIDLLLIIVLFGGMALILINSFSQFAAKIPDYADKLNRIISSTAARWGLHNFDLTNFKLADFLSSIHYQSVLGSFFYSTFSFLGSFLFVIFFFIFVMTGYKVIYNAIRKRFLSNYIELNVLPDDITKGISFNHEKMPKEETEKSSVAKEEETNLQKTFNEITEQIQKYITTKFFISLFTGIIEGGIVWIFGVDFAVIWGVTIFLTNFIPNIGSFIGIILPCLMALIQFESLGYAFIMAIVLIVVDMIIGNYIEPRVFGERLGLNPLVILLSLLLWGYIWGIIGAILSVPLTSLIKIMISRSESPNMIFLNDLMSQ